MSALFCDLVGFTSRAEAMDPEDVHGLLGAYYATACADRALGGTVAKFIGDAVFGVFGAPPPTRTTPSAPSGPRWPAWRRASSTPPIRLDLQSTSA